MLIACIGSRDLRKEELSVCEKIGRLLVEKGYQIITGNAKGADQAFARGGNSVDQTKVTLVLPWQKYENHVIIEGNKVMVYNPDNPEHKDWEVLAQEVHPSWDRLSNGVKKLHSRNVGIVKPAQLVIAFPKVNKFGQLGGTGQGIRIAERLGIKVQRLDRRLS